MRLHLQRSAGIGIIVLLLLIWPAWAHEEETSKGQGYANPQLLIETWELQRHLADPDLRIVDVRSAQEYAKGHIINAVPLDPHSLDDLEANKKGLPLPIEKAEAIFGGLGIDQDTRVVAYDNAGSLFATRLFYVLEFFGHSKVEVLNGGLTKWVREGRPLITEVPQVPKKRFVAKPNPDLIATAEYVKANLKNPKVCLIDARSPEEYAGEVPGKDVQRAGRIPGAASLDWTTTIDPVQKTFKPAEELKQLFKAAGATLDREVVTYCRTGVRGAHDYFVARLLGYTKVKNYDGSWIEWGNNPDLPMER